jgi:hypothetical protein
MIDLSVLCDRFYPIEQGYITGERGVQIEHGWDDGPDKICHIEQIGPSSQPCSICTPLSSVMSPCSIG